MRSRDDQYRVPDQREVRERLVRLRNDETRYNGHAFKRHVDIGPADTRARAEAELHAATREKPPPSDVTRWTRDQYLARAVIGVEQSPQYRATMAEAEAKLRSNAPPQTLRPVVRVPLRDALGPDWRSGVAGHRMDPNGYPPTRFTDGAEVVAVYRARPSGGWYLHTCYPHPTSKTP